MNLTPLNPQQLRRIPKQFSWVDHRLVRQGYLQRCDHAALSLYLFYLTVADAKGMSYYADARLMSMLSMTQHQLQTARLCLVSQDLIAYAHPFVQVLSLDKPTHSPAHTLSSRKVEITENVKKAEKSEKADKTNNPREAHATPTITRRENGKALIQILHAQLRGKLQ